MTYLISASLTLSVKLTIDCPMFPIPGFLVSVALSRFLPTPEAQHRKAHETDRSGVGTFHLSCQVVERKK